MPEIASSPETRRVRRIPRGVLDRIDDALVALDRAWRMKFVNRAGERLTGRRADELLKRLPWVELPAFYGAQLERECHRVMEEMHPREFEVYDVSAGRWLEHRLFPSEEGVMIQTREISLRKRVEIAQEDRERWYSALVNSVGGIVWVADAETVQFSFVSRQAEQILGYPVDQWLKEPHFWRNHLHPDDREWCSRYCFEASAQGRDHEFECRMIAADGRVVWLRDIVTVKRESGQMLLRGIMLDITERKEAEDRLHRREARFRKLVEDAWDSFGLMQEDGTFLYISPSIERMLGYHADELLGRRGYDWIHPEDKERNRAFLAEVFNTEEGGSRVEYRCRHKDGSWHTLEAIGKRYIDDQKRTLAIINIRDITERSRMEERLRESEGRFRLLFERNAAGMAISDLDYRFLQVNPAFCRMLGYSEHELLEKTVRDVTHPDDFLQTEERMGDIRAGRRKVIDLEKRYIHKDGHIVWGHVTGIYVSAEGRPTYCIATVQDITASKLADEALRASEERYRSLALASTQVIWLSDGAGESMPGQLSWSALTGQSDEEITGWGWLNAIHPDDRERAREVWARAIQQKISYESELRIRTAKGDYRDFAVRGVPVFNRDGGIREWVGTCTDITEQKRAAADILNWKNRYEAAVAASGQVLYDWNLETDEQTFGEGLRDLLGYDPVELAGGVSLWLEVIHPEDRDKFLQEADRVEHSKEPFHLEYRVRHKDGSYRMVSDRGRFYSQTDGIPGSMIGFISDITERTNALRQLASAKEAAEAANRAKDDFLAALSHELRTPLNPVLMLTSELENSTDLPSSARQDFAMIRKNVELEARLIDDLLDLTRITRGKVQLNPRVVDAHKLIHQAIDVIRSDIEAKHLTLTLELSASNSRIMGDAVRLQQVVWNVLKNAVKFTGDGGEVTVRTCNTGEDKLLLEFSDTGLGISAEDLSHIFEPFVQGGAGGHQFGGLGLGLTISRRIVELHKGRIWAESAGRGKGSTFFVELPKVSADFAEQVSIPAVPASPSSRQTNGRRILLVEDHEPTRVTLARLLTRQGYQVASAESVDAARALAEHNSFDLVVSDIGLPDGSGHDLMMELRDKYGLAGIALSGYGMEDDIQRSLASGFVSHLTKPVDMQSLLRAITEVEAHSQAHAVG